MPLIVALVADRVGRARLQDAMRGLAVVRCCDSAAEARVAALGPGIGAVVVEPRDPSGTSTDALVAALRRERPAVPVLAYCSLGQGTAADIHAVTRAGASTIVLRGYDDERVALRRALDAARDDCTAERALLELEELLPVGVRPLVAHCLHHARAPLTVAGVAGALGVHRKTLVNRLAGAGLPGPRAIIGWSRLLLVADALADRGRPVERVALDFAFPSSAAMRNMLRRYTGLRPADVRRSGGLAAVLPLCRRALVTARSARGVPERRP
jgi:AraC-like DNA-binding protein